MFDRANAADSLLGGIERMVNSLIKTARETWFFWVFCLCFGFVAGTLPWMPWATTIGFSLAFALLAAIWVVADAKRRQRVLSFGFPALVFFFWPIFAPLYLFQTRGVRAFLTLLGFAIAYYISTVVGVLIGRMTI